MGCCRSYKNIVLADKGAEDKKYHVVDHRHMIPKSHRQQIVDNALATTEQDNEFFMKKFEDRVRQ